MRSCFLLALFVAAAACGDKSAPLRGPSAEVNGESLRASAARSARSGPGAAGGQASSQKAPANHLEDADGLARFFEALARLERGEASDDVRVVQYGDSHTASDLGTSVARHALQTRFGDGGRGFVSIGKPWGFYFQDGIRGGMTAGFQPSRVTFRHGQFEGADGAYGLLGFGIAASRAGERAWTEIGAHTSRIELDYGLGPNGGSFDVSVDGGPAVRVTTKAPALDAGYRALEVAEGPHQVEVRTVGDGEVRLFGMALDRAQVGVVFDALGINGATIFTALRWSEPHFAEQLRHRAPDLVVLAYGTNESLDPKLSDADYEHALGDLIGRVRRAAPAASCLLLGPTDRAVRTGPEAWTSAPRLAEIVEVQRRVARASGCAFYDQLEAMGGLGSMVTWTAEPDPRGAHDRVHLTRSGYAYLGAAFADDLLRTYDAWRAGRVGNRPTAANQPQ